MRRTLACCLFPFLIVGCGQTSQPPTSTSDGGTPTAMAPVSTDAGSPSDLAIVPTDGGTTPTDGATTYDDPPLNGGKLEITAANCGCQALGYSIDVPGSCNTSVTPNTIKVQSIDLDADSDQPQALAGGLEVIACRNIPYSNAGITNANDSTPIYTRMDLYLPKDYKPTDAPRPVVLFIHGGGWWSGNASAVTPNQLAYLAKGYAVVSLNYRLSCYTYPDDPTHPPAFPDSCTMRKATDPQWVTFPKNLQDIKTAVQFMNLRMSDIVKTDEIVAWGFSAGAHLSVLLGVSGGVSALEGRAGATVSSRVAAVVAQSPATDLDFFAHPTDPDHIGPGLDEDSTYPAPSGGCPENDDWFNSAIAIRTMVGAEISPPTAQSSAATPTTYLDAADPPMFVLTGTCDATVTYKGNINWANAYAAPILGANFTLSVAVGGQHGGTLGATNPGAWKNVRDFVYAKAPL